MKTITVQSAQEFELAYAKALVDGAELVSVQFTYPKNDNTRFDMKRVILYVALGVLVAVIGILSVQAYNNYRHDRDTAQSAAAAKANADAAKQAAAQQAEQAQLAKLKAQCASDHQLFVQTKGKSPAGDCDPSLTIAQ